MKDHYGYLLSALDGLQLCLDATGFSDRTLLSFVIRIDRSKYTLKVVADPQSVKNRMALLTPQKRAAQKDSRWGPCTKTRLNVKRPGRSKTVAQRFLDDGEKGNYFEYCKLYPER